MLINPQVVPICVATDIVVDKDKDDIDSCSQRSNTRPVALRWKQKCHLLNGEELGTATVQCAMIGNQSGLGITIFILNGLSMLVIFTTSIILYAYRNDPDIKSASHFYCQCKSRPIFSLGNDIHGNDIHPFQLSNNIKQPNTTP